MRNDMAQLVSKKVRRVSLVRRPGRPARDLDDLPSRERIERGRCHHNNVANGAPLKRWLQAQVGRPWRAVYAELCGRFDARNNQAAAARKWVGELVERSAFRARDGVIKTVGTWGGETTVTGLYVDPESGLLQYAARPNYRARERREREAYAAKAAARRVEVSPTRQLHLVDGQWFWVEMAPIVPPARYTPPPKLMMDGSWVARPEETDYDTVCVDVMTGGSYYRVPTGFLANELELLYGRSTHYGVRRTQASHADIRRHVGKARTAAGAGA